MNTLFDNEDDNLFDPDELDEEQYDVDGIKCDIRHNNFDRSNIEAYRFENQVFDSLFNGQFTQARRICESANLCYEEELRKFRNRSSFRERT